MAATSSRRGRKRRAAMSEINVVPYIDVMLVLLVIFMVTAPFVPTSVVELPTIGQASSSPKAYVEVVVPVSGELTVRPRHLTQTDDRSITLAVLGDTLNEVTEGNKNVPVVISGDREARYQAILEIMDAVRKAGFTRPGLMVRNAADGAEPAGSAARAADAPVAPATATDAATPAAAPAGAAATPARSSPLPAPSGAAR